MINGDHSAQPVPLSIASGYFYPEDFGLLASHLEPLPQVRLLLGLSQCRWPGRGTKELTDMITLNFRSLSELRCGQELKQWEL